MQYQQRQQSKKMTQENINSATKNTYIIIAENKSNITFKTMH